MKCIITLLFVTLLSCNYEEGRETSIPIHNVNRVKIEQNVNIETVGIILGLSEMGDYVLSKYHGKNYSLIKIYRKEFDNYRQHPAVLKANELGKLGLLQFNFYYYGLYYSELPEFKLIHARPEEFYNSNKLSKQEIDRHYKEFDMLIQQFYEYAQVASFLIKNEKLYKQIGLEIKETLPGNIIQTMENFFGDYENEYVISPSPTIFTGFNFGPTISSKNKNIFYYLTGPAYDLNKNLSLRRLAFCDSLGFNDKEYITDLAIHEFGHSFVRFLDKKRNRDLIEKLEYLNTKELKSNLENIGEGTDWLTGFEEHLVRAVEIMVWIKLEENEIANDKLIFEEEQEGLLYIRSFVASLKEYERTRNKYKTLENYFTKMINDIRNKTKKK